MRNESGSGVGIDLTLVKNLISSIPNERYVESTDDPTKRPPQEMVDTAYDSLLIDLSTTIDCQCFDRPCTTSSEHVNDFLESSLDTDKLQTTNILLTSQLWRDVVLGKKQDLNAGIFHRGIDEENFRINFSEISATKMGNGTITNPVLTTIQFDFDNNPDGTLTALNKTEKSIKAFRKLIREQGTETSVDEISEIAGGTRDFSIHKYYIPNGFSQQTADECCLLLRYDHCSLKHRNGSMPALYREVYPEFVEEPHFHFNSGFGSVYKLSNDGATHKYGVGYAIGITGLKNYLIKLRTGNYSSPAEKRLYTENDFGMPFLHILNGASLTTTTPPSGMPPLDKLPPNIHMWTEMPPSGNYKKTTANSSDSFTLIDKIIEQLGLLEDAYRGGDKVAELQFAYNVTNLMSACPTKKVTREKNLSNDDNFIHVYSKYVLNKNEKQFINELELLAENGDKFAIENWYRLKGNDKSNENIEMLVKQYSGKNIHERLVLSYKLYGEDKNIIDSIYQDIYDAHIQSLRYNEKSYSRDKYRNPYNKKKRALIKELQSTLYAQSIIELVHDIIKDKSLVENNNIFGTLLDMYLSEPLILSSTISKSDARFLMKALKEHVQENPNDKYSLFTLGRAYCMLGRNQKEKEFGNEILYSLASSHTASSTNGNIPTDEETLIF